MFRLFSKSSVVSLLIMTFARPSSSHKTAGAATVVIDDILN